MVAMAMAFLSAPGCAGKRSPLESFIERQDTKIIQKSVYNQADFGFWAARYEPVIDDLEEMRAAWVEHGQAFPESKTFDAIEKEVRKRSQRAVLVSLFMTMYENADLKDKSLGWSVYPVPTKIVELSETDVILRTLMPIKNQWARYFMLIYPNGIWNESSVLVISNRDSRVELVRRH